MAQQNDIQYVSRPKGKHDMTTKGKLNEWSNGYREFIPQGTRENQRELLKQLGDSSFYKTNGKKESSYSLHLNVDGKSEDPVAEMFEQFKVLTEGQRKEQPKLPEGSQGRMLFDNGQGLQVWLDTTNAKLTVMAQLDCTHDIERQLLQAQSQMNVCVGRHRQELVNLGNNK